MKRSALALFLCYPLLPVAIVCAMGFAAGHPMALVTIAYYCLLVWGLWGCAQKGGWPGIFYRLALATVVAHVLLLIFALFPDRLAWPVLVRDLSGLVLWLTVPGVYLWTSLAGAALARRLHRPVEAVLQFIAPILTLLSLLAGEHGLSFLVISFLGQGAHAFKLFHEEDKLGRQEQANADIGLSPSEV